MRRDVRQIARRLVSRYKTRDPRELCDCTNVLVVTGDIGNILGCYMLIKRQKCILLNERIIGTPLEKIVLCHELAHSILHRRNEGYFYGSTFFNKRKEENEANVFAAELLLSDEDLREYAEYGYTIEQIARMTGYHAALIELKLNNAG